MAIEHIMQRLKSVSSNGASYLPSVLTAAGQTKLLQHPPKGAVHVTHCQLFTTVTAFMTLLLFMQVRMLFTSGLQHHTCAQMWQLDSSHASGSFGKSTDHSARRLKEPKHPFPELNHLVVVAGHAVFVGFDYTKTDDPNNWFLLEYQKYPEYPQSFMKHMELGVAQAAQDPKALLLFSGAQKMMLCEVLPCRCLLLRKTCFYSSFSALLVIIDVRRQDQKDGRPSQRGGKLLAALRGSSLVWQPQRAGTGLYRGMSLPVHRCVHSTSSNKQQSTTGTCARQL